MEGEVLVFTDDGVLPMLTGMAEAAREAGAVTAEQAGDWSREQRLRASEGRLFVAIPFLTVGADRP
ncbi:hypothetical protein [Nocardiopsis halotolerans]|uniref:hypothetical protein n=1 Tax=Nocardiopsis halotolerans TaxID=124252 RepID=UPI0003483D2E|nr:hypothetical protein [Nocardiopsis halotolerans]